MRLFGVGFGRTGTLSLKVALEQLGFGPCHHMVEVLRDPMRAAPWEQVARGGPVDWDDVFAGYNSAVDWPTSAFWRELMPAYPQAKIVLTVRDSAQWYESFAETILLMLTRPAEDQPDSPEARLLGGMVQHVIVGRSFEGELGSKDDVIGAFERHNAAVRAAVPPERLLEFHVADGWQPLCDFVGAEVPERPFPKVNDRQFFHSFV